MKTEDLKLIVKEKYSSLTRKSSLLNQQGCCGESEFSMISGEYSNLAGYIPDADLGLGCGLPVEFAGIKEGDRVLDLGSGAGNDCFVAHMLAGETGKVTGLDFTKEMIEKAQHNLAKTGFKNIEFIFGDIEEIPLPDSAFDVVISNCVLNLVPDKEIAFREIHRVLKPGGHFCISDVVLNAELPEELKRDAELYAGCISGAIIKSDYLNIINAQGFNSVKVQKEKEIIIPDSILIKYLNITELKKFKESGDGVLSITVTAKK